MCGIAGIVTRDPSEISDARLKKMTDALIHRGPDGEGFWIESDRKVGFGHRRLAVIDLTAAAVQPMQDPSGRYTLIFNGEIYNYIELKALLQTEGYRFRSGSDTEVLLAMYAWQQEGCLDYLDGMFAFAIHDATRNRLFCARDRFGEKPFYYAHEPGRYFLFGSEMKALWAAGITKEVNLSMAYNYLAYDLLEDAADKSKTFYNGIVNLENSHYLSLDTSTLRLDKMKYWDINLSQPPERLLEGPATERFREQLTASVGRRLRSDVPVGTSLSGGLDSSAIASLAAEWLRKSGSRIRTFSARFPGFAKDEGTFMGSVIARTHADPVYVYPSGEDLIATINQVYYYQEEPFGSASVLAQYAVMQSAKEHGVTVLLDGQGADEILGGYRHYYPALISGGRKEHFQQASVAARAYLFGSGQRPFNGRVVIDGARLMLNDFPGMVKYFKTSRIFARQAFQPLFNKDFYANYSSDVHLPSPQWNGGKRDLASVLYYDTYVTGLSQLLRYADRNAMAHSREIRLPFLDHELVTYVFRLPADLKIRGAWTKYILRKAFEPALPPEVAWRKEKVGFEAPQKRWMEKPLVKESVLEAQRMLVEKGILHRKHTLEHANNVDWSILMTALLFG